MSQVAAKKPNGLNVHLRSQEHNILFLRLDGICRDGRGQ
jgi:hypothetical protein